jgi:simple sugar transport system ATP-binding protein
LSQFQNSVSFEICFDGKRKMTRVRMENIDKFFPSTNTLANDKACLVAEPGEIHAIVGENGAGKSTLMKILAGLEAPDSGSIFLNDRRVSFRNARDAQKAKIGMVHQHFLTLDDFTVAENVVFGDEPRRFGFALDRRAIDESVAKALGHFGFSLDTRSRAGDLGVGQRQQLEILRLLYRDAEVLILDEPTSVLAEQEIQTLFEVLEKLKKRGKTILIITHKVKDVMRISDSVSVLRNGKTLGRFRTADIDENELSAMIMGNSYSPGIRTPGHKSMQSKPALELRNLSLRDARNSRTKLDGITFIVREGEIVGITAVGGNGLKELEDVLSGFAVPSSGGIFLYGQPLSPIRRAAGEPGGYGYVPSDRMRRGACLPGRVYENFIAVDRKRYFPHGFLAKPKAMADTTAAIGTRSIKAEASFIMDVVSGGNIQKLVLARELPDGFSGFALLCEPTWGLDVASTKSVHEAIGKSRLDGASYAILTSDPDEVLALSDRILVLYHGKLVCDVPNDGTIDREILGTYMLGLRDDFANRKDGA